MPRKVKEIVETPIPCSELAQITWRYNRTIWVLKGLVSNLQISICKLPIPNLQKPGKVLEARNKLAKALEETQNHLEYCE